MDSKLLFREATRLDVPFIIEMIADDKLGMTREDYRDPLPNVYFEAFDKIDKDKNQELIVVMDVDEVLLGTMQLSFIQYLTYKGGIRAQIEGVRIAKERRGQGTGKLMFEWAIRRSKERNAHLLQLTSDKKRPQALKFYTDLGFKSTHEGMKMHF